MGSQLSEKRAYLFLALARHLEETFTPPSHPQLKYWTFFPFHYINTYFIVYKAKKCENVIFTHLYRYNLCYKKIDFFILHFLLSPKKKVSERDYQFSEYLGHSLMHLVK